MTPLWIGERAKTVFFLFGIALILAITGALSRIDNVIYDAGQKIAKRSIPIDVVLVVIDEQSLSSLGRWPWSRKLHAQLIERLHVDGARVIAMDVIFTEPQTDDLQADLHLSSAVARAGNVVLPVVFEKVRSNGQFIESLPIPSLAVNALSLGRVHAELDADSVARSIYLREGIGQPIWPHFSQAILSALGQSEVPKSVHLYSPGDQAAGALIKLDQKYINFSTAHQQFQTLSYSQVLHGHFSPGTFAGKLVLVGATASGMADSLPTPVSGFRQPMPGVEFLANTLVSLRSNTLITRSPEWLNVLLACIVAAFPMLWLPYVRTSTGLLLNAAMALFVLGITISLPLIFHVWVPLSAGIVGLASAYPLWAWRKLESASLYLDAELIRLEQELGSQQMKTMGIKLIEPTTSDPFQHRIDQVRLATKKLQQLSESQKETLAFVSHDIRVPLASATALIKIDLHEDHPAHKQLARALAWTEDYLQTARAQMLRADEFSDLNVIDLLHQVADDMYPLAQVRDLKLILDLPFEPVWIRGHFETLSRAITNLLSNALKFSPTGGQIGLNAQVNDREIVIKITDQGPGIPPQIIDHMFKRFSRGSSDDLREPNGVGLGLYFVKTVVQQHSGFIEVSVEPDRTVLTMKLPLM